ncbi:hypothetical protein ACLB1E_22875 [Escherichia coli]
MRKQPWTETIWRQSLRGAGFRNLALGWLNPVRSRTVCRRWSG